MNVVRMQQRHIICASLDGNGMNTKLQSTEVDNAWSRRGNSGTAAPTGTSGTGFKGSDYNSSTLRSDSYNWVMRFGGGNAYDYRVDDNSYVRSVLAF